VITSVGGQSVSSNTALTNVLEGHHPGDKVSVGWTDSSGQQHTATMQLATGPTG
jgi:S1-C subfamily serine protease